MGDYQAVVIESQADWLTVSAHGRDRAQGLAWLAHEWASAEKRKDDFVRPWRLMGYVGQMCGRVRWGQRDEDCCLVQLSGDVADKHLEEAVTLADTVTRVDMAVTIRTKSYDFNLGGNAYLHACWYHEANPTSALPWRVVNAAGGETVYIGSRESDYFCRIYDKFQESVQRRDPDDAEHYAQCWRYELECKGRVASPTAMALVAAPSRPAHCQRAVYDYLHEHGVEPGYPVDGQRVLVPGFRRRSDAESRLAHLSRNVRPTIEALRQIGRLDDAIIALGLADDLDGGANS